MNSPSYQTRWYSPTLSAPEGPYQAIGAELNAPIFVPANGPLAGTPIQSPTIWCAVSEGSLLLTPKVEGESPQIPHESVRVRGYYDIATDGSMVWYPIGEPWRADEITEVRHLQNISYQLYNKVPRQPRFVFLFGAGASYGSDSQQILNKGLLPPLGPQLFSKLQSAANFRLWSDLPAEIEELFKARPFEEAMESLDQMESQERFGLGRDIELALYFSQFRPKPSNLYRKLGFRIAEKLGQENDWSIGIVTLNYERLLEESLLSAHLFPIVKGVTFYDIDPIDLPSNALTEICYPHGGCQFIISHGDRFQMNMREQLVVKNIESLTGVQQLLSQPNIIEAHNQNHFPMICRYEANKRPSVNNYFIRQQKERAADLLGGATMVTIVGAQCSHETDNHIWTPLAANSSLIVYVDPSVSGQEKFREWAHNSKKVDGINYQIVAKTFHDGFNEILQLNGLELK